MSEENIVVMFPDLKGQGVQSSFGGKILHFQPQAKLIPVLNGLSAGEAQKLSKKLEGLFFPVTSFGRGLLSTLVDGYQYCLNNFPDHVIVRLDTAEHPVEAIPALLREIERGADMVIGDLDFSKGCFQYLRENSIDEFAHLDLFPALYGQFTRGKLPLSCAHGFQVFAPGKLASIFEEAKNVVAEVEKEVGHVEWGFDGAMALSAYHLGMNVEIVK
ncbi:MAG: hypothetical protein AAB890_03340, partial [Patescibacteria group bacterium]